jgi:hypothetical protein
MGNVDPEDFHAAVADPERRQRPSSEGMNHPLVELASEIRKVLDRAEERNLKGVVRSRRLRLESLMNFIDTELSYVCPTWYDPVGRFSNVTETIQRILQMVNAGLNKTIRGEDIKKESEQARFFAQPSNRSLITWAFIVLLIVLFIDLCTLCWESASCWCNWFFAPFLAVAVIFVYLIAFRSMLRGREGCTTTVAGLRERLRALIVDALRPERRQL